MEDWKWIIYDADQKQAFRKSVVVDSIEYPGWDCDVYEGMGDMYETITAVGSTPVCVQDTQIFRNSTWWNLMKYNGTSWNATKGKTSGQLRQEEKIRCLDEVQGFRKYRLGLEIKTLPTKRAGSVYGSILPMGRFKSSLTDRIERYVGNIKFVATDGGCVRAWKI